MAREKLDVVTIVCANRSYNILNIELGRVGAFNPGPKTLAMLDLHNPVLDWVKLAAGMGVEASRATSVEEFAAQFESEFHGRQCFVVVRRPSSAVGSLDQEGYGVFSVNPAQRETVIHYIDVQAEHHRKWSFEQEFLTLLKKSGAEYDARFVFG